MRSTLGGASEVLAVAIACHACGTTPADGPTGARRASIQSVIPAVSISAPPPSSAAPTPDVPSPPLPDVALDPPAAPGRAKTWPAAANLGVVGELRGAPTLPAIVVAGNLVLTTSFDGSAIHRLGASPSSAPIAVAPEVSPVAGVAQYEVFSALGLAVERDGDALVAFDVRAARRRWSAPIRPPAAPVASAPPTAGGFTLKRVLTAGTTLIAVLEWKDPIPVAGSTRTVRAEIVALDASRGTILWRRLLAVEWLSREHVACADGRVHLEEEGFGVVTLALDAASGRTLWSIDDERYESPAGPGPEVEGGQMVSIHKVRGGERELVTRDAASGRLVARRPLPKSLAAPEIAAMRIAAGSLYAIAEESSRTRVVALDVATARLRWESAPIEAHTGLGQTWLNLDDDVVLACLPDGMLRAFEPKRGAIVWHHGLGQCNPIALARPDPAGPALILARAWSQSAPSGDPLGKQRLLVFARGAAPPPLEHATFEGAAEPGARVRVGTTVVTANARGRYRAVVDARGVVTVEGYFTASRKFPLESHVVELDGRRKYTADLQYIDSGP